MYSLCTVIRFPNNVTICTGEEARFSCFVEFTSGTPTGVTWTVNGESITSLDNRFMLFDNSTDGSSLPAIVNNTLFITNVSSTGLESGSRFLCDQNGTRSDPASLIIISELCYQHSTFDNSVVLSTFCTR